MSTDRPRALKFAPPPITHGRYVRCEVCALWFPEDEMEYYHLKERCPECKQGAVNSAPAPELL